jgi:hypothetical protein
MSRLRRRELIPEDENIVAVIAEPKTIHGQFGRQVEVKNRVAQGDYKGTEFKDWLSFGKDKDTGEEFVPHGGSLYSFLAMVEPNLEEILEDEDLTDKHYEQFVKKAVKKLDGLKYMARVGHKAPKNSPEKKRNYLVPGTIGPYVDPDEALDADMAEAPF